MRSSGRTLAVTMPSSAALLLDDPDEWSSFGRALTPDGARSEPTWRSQLLLSGIDCAACALTIEAALVSVPGVIAARVDAATRRADITWSAARTLPSRLIDAIEAVGYGAMPAGDGAAREHERRESRRLLWRWGVAAFCMMQVMMYAWPAYVAGPGELDAGSAQLLRWASWVLTLPILVFACGPFFRGALRDLRHGRIGMDVPVALGILITFLTSTAATFESQGVGPGVGQGEVYYDSIAMFVAFLLAGRWLQARLAARTSGTLDSLLARMPQVVRRIDRQGAIDDEALLARMPTREASVRQLHRGDLLQVRAGETFPADGVLVASRTRVDEALLTGEAAGLERGPGDPVLAGSHNLGTSVCMRVERLGEDTRFAQVVQLVEAARGHKPPGAALADRVARHFLAAVLVIAIAAGLAQWWEGASLAQALRIASVVLIVTCPCALSIATPAALLAAAGALARQGVLVRRLGALEALANVDTVIFDKTGTLTDSRLLLAQVRTAPGLERDHALVLAAALGAHSLHPMSRALVAAASARLGATDVVERAGRGVKGRVEGRSLRLGSAAWCHVHPHASAATEAHLSDEWGWLASFSFDESLRPDARAAVQDLQAAGLDVRILSGDALGAVARVGESLGIAHCEGGLEPAAKLASLRALQQAGRRVAMVGDGMNDTPVLAVADVSIAFGDAVPLARAGADLTVMGGEFARIAETWRLARRTVRIVRQNLAWAALYNAVSIPLAIAGLMPAWLAGLGMACSSLFVVANAARLSSR